MAHGLLRECQSEYNTPILLVKKPRSNEYRLVQDLRAANQIVQDVYPVVGNLYTLLTAFKETDGCFTVLDLKDASFASLWNLEVKRYLPSSGRIQKVAGRFNCVGPFFRRDLKIVRESWGIKQLRNWRTGIKKMQKELCSGVWMISSWEQEC